MRNVFYILVSCHRREASDTVEITNLISRKHTVSALLKERKRPRDQHINSIQTTTYNIKKIKTDQYEPH